MVITELLLAELDRKAIGILKTLERVPEGKNDWKTHEIYCRSLPEHSFRLIPARQLALFFPQFLESRKRGIEATGDCAPYTRVAYSFEPVGWEFKSPRARQLPVQFVFNHFHRYPLVRFELKRARAELSRPNETSRRLFVRLARQSGMWITSGFPVIRAQSDGSVHSPTPRR